MRQESAEHIILRLQGLANFTLPGDTDPSSHYWKQDIIDPQVEMKDGYIPVPKAPGIGYTPNKDRIENIKLFSKTYHI